MQTRHFLTLFKIRNILSQFCRDFLDDVEITLTYDLVLEKNTEKLIVRFMLDMRRKQLGPTGRAKLCYSREKILFFIDNPG